MADQEVNRGHHPASFGPPHCKEQERRSWKAGHQSEAARSDAIPYPQHSASSYAHSYSYRRGHWGKDTSSAPSSSHGFPANVDSLPQHSLWRSEKGSGPWQGGLAFADVSGRWPQGPRSDSQTQQTFMNQGASGYCDIVVETDPPHGRVKVEPNLGPELHEESAVTTNWGTDRFTQHRGESCVPRSQAPKDSKAGSSKQKPFVYAQNRSRESKWEPSKQARKEWDLSLHESKDGDKRRTRPSFADTHKPLRVRCEDNSMTTSSPTANISTPPVERPSDGLGLSGAIVVRTRTAAAGLDGRAASDTDMDLDDEGASEDEDEEQSQRRFEELEKSWKVAVQAAGASVNSKVGLPCLVCRKFSNTVQVYPNSRALLQHAETHTKLQPNQHSAYAAALKATEADAEGGSALVPASKKLRVVGPPERVWPPIVVVENLRTGVKDGKWDGVSDKEIKEAFGNEWPVRRVKEKWKHDGHTGVVFLYFEETCYGFDRAREMDESWRTKGRGRDEWARVRPPRKRHGDSIQQEHDTWQRYSRDLVEEDRSRRLFCYLATVDDMERIEGHVKGQRWQTITGEELEARRKREKDSVLEGNLEHAKTRLANDALTQKNAELTSRVEEKELELQTIRMERAHLNEQHENWVNERLERIARAHREETLAAQKKAATEKAALEAQLEELHRARESDQAAMVALKQDAERSERRLRHVFETGLKAIDQEYNEKEKAAMTRADEMLQREREKLQREKEAATRSLLAEQAEKMRAIESTRAETEALQKEAQQLRAALLERAKTEETEVIDDDNECQCCTEPFSKERRRAMLGCGHTTMCKACSEEWLASDKFKPPGKRKRPSYECPLRCKLGQNNKVIELLGPIGVK